MGNRKVIAQEKEITVGLPPVKVNDGDMCQVNPAYVGIHAGGQHDSLDAEKALCNPAAEPVEEVWVVEYVNRYEGSSLMGVFRSREAAEIYVKRHEEEEDQYGYYRTTAHPLLG